MLLLQPGESRKSVYRGRRAATQSRLHHTVLDHLSTTHPHRRPGLHTASDAGPSAGRRIVVRQSASSRWCRTYPGRRQPAADTGGNRAARQRLHVAADEQCDESGWRWRPQRSLWAAAADRFSHGGGGASSRRRRREGRDVDNRVTRPADNVSASRCCIRWQPESRRPLSLLRRPVIATTHTHLTSVIYLSSDISCVCSMISC